MHIKQGFKSYKDQTVTEPFSPHHNVVVGRNGSGKSNFFAAIRFVLSDAYTNMGREERQALLHESTGMATLNAYVEIAFDNSDHRFPTGREEVILRRTIGLKKDEYSLDKKSVPKSEIVSLLEAAGFSRANPYYIVPQGRITSLCNSKDHERLALLKEVAGTRVYEQRRQESLKIMEETDSKRGKIQELLTYIEERLAELEEEKEELRKFQELDRDRRCLEYTVYQRESSEAAEKLELLEEEHRELTANTAQRRGHTKDRERLLAELKDEIKTIRQSLTVNDAEKSQLQQERQDLITSRAQLEVFTKDLEDSSRLLSSEKDGLVQELRRLDGEIKRKQAEVEKCLPEFQALVEQDEAAQQAVTEGDQRRQFLQAKQGRSARFRDRKERDAYLKTEIDSIKSAMRAEQDQMTAVEKELATGQQRLSASGQDEMRASFDQAKREMETVQEEYQAVKAKREALLSKRRDLWHQDAQATATAATLKEELRKSHRSLASCMDKSTSDGLEAVKRIAEKHQLLGVYGPLYELFEVDHAFHTAVEVTAGQSLFHVVVDNDETVAKILDVMNRERCGRVTFMPLNRLSPTVPTYPDSPDATPMLSKLRFDDAYAKAFEQVFSKTVICPDLVRASTFAKDFNLNAITLEGDRAERKGALTGGYHDTRRSRLEAIKAFKELRMRVAKEERRATDVKRQLHDLERDATTLQNQLSDLETRRRRLQTQRETLASELLGQQRDQTALKDRMGAKERSLKLLQESIRAAQVQIDALKQEMTTALNASLTADEVRELTALSQRLDMMQKDAGAIAKRRAQVEMKKTVLENELQANLLRRRDEVQMRLEQVDSAELGGNGDMGSAQNLDQAQSRLEKTTSQLTQLDAKLTKMQKSMEELNARLKDSESSLEQVESEQHDDQRELDQYQKHVERYLAKRSLYAQKKDESAQKIRELGALPEEAFEKYRSREINKLIKQLHKVNDKLKKYGHVNKKALEQYNNFTKQRDALIGRKKELDQSAKSIEELIEVLDQRKDEAIQRTFAEVSKNFEAIFEKLVPMGRGRLSIQRRVDPDQEDTDAMQVDGAAQDSSENYTGIGIKTDEGLLMQQLSGGQKSLVALAMIFAIQQCDPAPFYLFDEIDANLDAAYRSSVAAMIHELSENAQFITTTFRPEMLRYANKFYGVTFRDRVSRISVITKDDAMQFVEQEAQA